MDILRKYGAATNIYIPVIKRAVVDFALAADWTPAAGDVTISKDGGAAANITTLPVAITMGNSAMWNFALSATEMQAAKIVVVVADAATKAVEDQAIPIATYGNAAAEHAVDLDDSVRAGLTALPNAAAEAAGGLFTRGAGAGQINQDANGRIDSRWVAGNVTVATNNDKTGYTLSAAGVQAIWDALTSALTTAGSVGKLIVDNLNAAITSRAVAGDSMALTAAAINAIWDELTAEARTAGSYGQLLKDILDAAISTRASAAALATVQADTDDIQTRLPAALVGGRMASNAEVVGDKTGYALSASGVDAILDDVVEGTLTMRQLLRIVLAAVAGKSSGFPSGPAIYRDNADLKARITATVDADGNRSVVTLDGA